jgi:hypothetical protein
MLELERIHRVLERDITSLRSKLSWSTAYRVISALTIGLMIYWSWGEWSPFTIGGTFLLITAFVLSLRRFFKTRDALRACQAQREEVQMELRYLKEGYFPLANGAKYDQAAHPYSFDLGLFGSGSLFHRLNRCYSKRGEQKLAELLLKVPDEKAHARSAWYADLAQQPHYLIQYRALGRAIPPVGDLAERTKVWKERPVKAPSLAMQISLVVLSILSTGVLLPRFIFYPSLINFQWWLYSFVLNLIVLFFFQKELRFQLGAIAPLSEQMKGYAKLLAFWEQHPEQSEMGKALWQQNFAQASAPQALKKLGRLLSSLEHLANPVVLIFLNGLFFYHLWRLNALALWHQQYAHRLQAWLDSLAEYEVALSMAQFHHNHPDFCRPQWSETPILEAQAAGHPFISAVQRVTNDFKFDGFQYAILTGSNMSGKSTFLRTIGLNILMAELGLPVCARSFTTYPFRIFTSMNTRDNLLQEESYFKAEVSRLKALKESLKATGHSFLILDEILRGTNSDDKKNGTRLFIESLEAAPAFGILATHDIDIAQLADRSPALYRKWYFESTVEGDELHFDYRLRQGVCTTPNATQLMKNNGII